MPTPLELYRDWERDPPNTVVHVLRIDVGLDSERITVTDKPYIDKGVSGVRYHHTYPAPIHAIVSDIGWSATLSSSSFDDVVLSNGDGKLNSLINTPGLVLGKSFSMLRGDRRWSLLSRDLPELFVEVFAGTVSDVRPEKNGALIRLSLIPFKYSLDSTFASKDQPLLVGGAIGVPMTLVDAATFQYRYSSGRLQSDTPSSIVIRDKGVLLALTTDYARTDESGIYQGLIDFVIAPSGTATAHIKGNINYTGDLPASWFLMDYVRPEYKGQYEGQTTHNYFGTWAIGIRTLPSVGKVFIAVPNPAIVPYLLVGGAVKDSTYEGAYLDLTTVLSGTVAEENFVDFDMSQDGQYLYVLLRGPTQTLLLQRCTLSTPGLITSAGAADQSTTSIQGFSSVEDVRGMRLSSDGLKMFITEGNGDYSTRLHEFAMPSAFTITGGLTRPGGVSVAIQFPYKLLARSTGRFSFFDDERAILFISDPNLAFGRSRVEKISLVTKGTLADGVYYDGRYLDLGMLRDGEGPRLDTHCALDSVGSKVYYMTSSLVTGEKGVHQFEVGADIPRGLFSFQPVSGGFSGTTVPYNLEPSCFFDSETNCGEALSKVISPLADDFLVAQDGEVYSVIVTPPEWAYAPTAVFSVERADLVGTVFDYVRHVDTVTSPSRLVIRYAPNFAVQTPSELAGSVGLDVKDTLSREWREKIIDYVGATDTRTVTKDAYWFKSGSAVLGEVISEEPTDIADLLEVLYSQDRFVVEVQTHLRATPYFDFLKLGMMLNLNFSSSISDVGDKFQLHGRKVNYSKNTQTLTVFK